MTGLTTSIVRTVILLIIFCIALIVLPGSYRNYMKKLNQAGKTETVNIGTKIIYVKTYDKLLFKAYELSLLTKELRTTFFTFAEIPIENPEQLFDWMHDDMLYDKNKNFFKDKAWQTEGTVSEAELALTQKLKELCIQSGPDFVSAADIFWGLFIINEDFEGSYLVAGDEKPPNYLEFESVLAQLFDKYDK